METPTNSGTIMSQAKNIFRRCRDYLEREYAQVGGNAGHPESG